MTFPATLFAAEQEMTDLLGFYATQAPDRRVRSIREFGAEIDGATDDLEAWQDAFAWAAGGQGRALYFPRGVSVVSERVLAPDGLHLFGDGPNNSTIKCTATPTPPQLGAPIWLGNFHMFAIGYRLTGSGDPFATSLDSYEASAPVNEGDTALTLDTPAEAADFVVGEIAYLRTQEQSIQVNSGFDLILPTDSSLVKVIAANPSTGVVTFERPAGFTSATAPLLCRIQDNATDPYGPIYFAQDVLIENMGFEGWCAVGSNSASGYDCHYRNIGGDVKDVIRANSLAYCSVDGFYGLWREVLAEIKLGAHDTVVRNLAGTNPDAVTTAVPGLVPIISVGEHCRNIEVLNFKIDAPNYNGYHVVGLQPGTNVTVRGIANVPSLEANPVVLYADAVKSVRNFSVDLAVVHRSAAVIYSQGTIGDADQLPKDGRVRVMSHSLSEESVQHAIVAYGGSGIQYSGRFTGSEGKGRIFWGEEASGNVALDLLIPEPVVEGAGVAVNIARCVAPDAGQGVAEFTAWGRTNFGTAAPTADLHAYRDRVINIAPVPGGYSGWVCVAGGTPGTWAGFGAIDYAPTSFGTAPPTTGAHVFGERVINAAPAAGAYSGWVCITGGTPGTWKGFGAIES